MTEFFSTLDQVMNEMLDSVPRLVEPQHMTTQKVMDEGAARGLKISPNKAMTIIRQQESQGKLKYDGKRLSPKTKKIVHVWVAVPEENPPLKQIRKKKTPQSTTPLRGGDLGE